MKLPALFLSLIALAISFPSLAQTPSSIEAVEYDPASNRWYVSNGSQTMLVTSDAGQSWDYFGAAHATHGMEVVGDYLYAINSNLLACYDLASGYTVSTQTVTGAGFLNGMGSHGNTLVISDFGTGRLLKVDISDPMNMVVSTLVAYTGTTPNGVVIDADGSRSVVVNWGGNADILGVDLETGAMTTLLDGSGLGNCDGVDVDSEGNYYVSSWTPNRITRFSPDFSESEIVVSLGLSSPADISYGVEIDTLAVANSGSSQVTFHSFANTESVGEVFSEDMWVELHGDMLVFSLNQGGEYELSSYGLNGALISKHSVSLLAGTTRVALDRLPAGFKEGAIISITSSSNPEQTKSVKLGLRRL